MIHRGEITNTQTVLKVVIVLVTVILIVPVGYLVYRYSPGFLLAIGLAFWADVIVVMIASRLYWSVDARGKQSCPAR